MPVESRYLDGSYLAENPTWDAQDAAWKASRVLDILNANHITPESICDVGCGSGDVLTQLRPSFPAARLAGFDISPQLGPFWQKHPGIEFATGEVKGKFDVLMMLDVFEHVRDPFSFLELARAHGRWFVFHIPLDLSALSVARGVPLMRQRKSVGHVHFYTKDLALETLTDCGYSIDDARYTDAASLTTHHTWRTKLAALPRRMAYAVDKDWGVRVLGGETLMVLAH